MEWLECLLEWPLLVPPPEPDVHTGLPGSQSHEFVGGARGIAASRRCRLIIDRDRMFARCVWISVLTFSFLFFLWVRAKTCLQRLKRGKERGVFLQEGRDRHSRSDY